MSENNEEGSERTHLPEVVFGGAVRHGRLIRWALLKVAAC